MSEALSVHGLSHTYDADRGEASVSTFDDVSLQVTDRQVVAILGPSGCGKSTFLRSIAGLEAPVGEVAIGGVAVHRKDRVLVRAEERNVGMVFQDFALFPSLSVAENIAFGIHRSPNREARVQEMLELVELVGLADRRPTTLSGGQQQRVALARALAPQPRLLLLDEPFANLDASLRRTVREELFRILRQEEVAVLLVTHDREEALGYADRVAVMIQNDRGVGRLGQFDSPQMLFERPASRTIAALVGRANFVRGVASGSEATTELGTVPIVGAVQGACTLVARPHQLGFAPASDGDAEVVRVVYRGERTESVVRCGENLLVLEHLSSDAPAVGTKGRIQVREALWALP